MELSKLFNNCRLYTAEQSTEELLDNGQPAVYAFYDRLHFDATRFEDSVDEYKTKHGRNVSLHADKWPLELRLAFRGNPERFKGEGRSLVRCMKPDNAVAIVEALQFLSILNEPLYIGETDDLRTRFIAHHEKDFLFRMKQDYKRPPSDFVILVFLCAKDDVRLLESILIQCMTPSHCRQRS